MTAFTVTFGKLGGTYPVPQLHTTARSRTDLIYKVEEHAHLFINPAMRGMGRPDLVGPVFQPNDQLTGGHFIVPHLGAQSAERFCTVKIEACKEQQ